MNITLHNLFIPLRIKSLPCTRRFYRYKLGSTPPPSIESINQRKMAFYRVEEYEVLT